MLETLFAVVLLVLGAGLLTVGAEAFAEHITEAASRLGVSVLALGVLLAGAEPEEAVTAMLAAGQGHPALAAGDAIGANLVILTVAIGLAALLTPLPVSRRVMEYAAAASAAGVLAVALMWNGVLGRIEGTVLVLAYAVGVVWVWRREQEPPVIGEMAELAEEEHARTGGPEPSRALLLVLLGLLGMVSGGFLAVQGAEGLVDAFGATESVVGLTVLALATSAEMIALVLAAHRRGVTEIALAGAVGSVAYNATITLGLAAWVDPLLLGRSSPVLVIGLVTAVLPLLLLAGRRTGSLPRSLGLLLALAYVGSTAWLFTL
ncbi:MAG: sodium:calcium antiporter [Nocardioidaceae bacterium]